MRWVLRIAAGLAAIVVLVLLVGALLPVAHTATTRADIDAPPAEVWATLADFSTHPSWREGVQRMEPRTEREGKPVWREVSQYGAMDMMVEESVPGRTGGGAGAGGGVVSERKRESRAV